MKRAKWLWLAALLAAPSLAASASTPISIPFELILVEPGNPPTATPGPGVIAFQDLAHNFTPQFGNSVEKRYLKPIWDRELFAFANPEDPGELNPYQIYAINSVLTLSGQGRLHFFVRDECSLSFQDCLERYRVLEINAENYCLAGQPPCLEADATGTSYQLVADHGLEYNQARATLTVYRDGSYLVDLDGDGLADGATLRFELGHVVNPPHYYAGDFHQHAGDYEEMPKAVRALENAAWGLELWAQTAHYQYRSYNQVLDEMGLRDSLFFLSGSEEAVDYYGHINIYPHYSFCLAPTIFGECDPFCDPAAGDCRPYCPDVSCKACKDFFWPADKSLFPPFYRARVQERLNPFHHPVFLQVNHPIDNPDIRCASGNNVFFQLDESGRLLPDAISATYNEDTEVCTKTYISGGNLKLWRDDFDGFELLFEALDYETLKKKWYGLLDQGYQYRLANNSDSHWLLNRPRTARRTYVYSPFPPSDDNRQDFVDRIILSLKAGQAFMTNGAVMGVSFNPESGGTVDPLGQTLTLPGATAARFSVGVQVRDIPEVSFGADIVAVVNGGSEQLFPMSLQEAEPIPGQRRFESSQEISLQLPPDRDAWVVIQVRNRGRDQPVLWAIANPIWVDRDGDGIFTPPRERPLIQEVGIITSNGDTLAEPGETVTIRFRVPNGHNDQDLHVYIAARRDSRYQISGGEAVCSHDPVGQVEFHECLYQVQGGYPEYDGPENEVRIGVSNAQGDYGWYFGTLNIKFSDADADGMADWWETKLLGGTTAAPDGDRDQDGLSNLEEYQTSRNPLFSLQANLIAGATLSRSFTYSMGWTNPAKADSDGDGLSDGFESQSSSCHNPVSADSDRDGVEDGLEFTTLHTDPCQADSDGDLMPDGWEYAYRACGLDPLLDDGQADPDHDSLGNLAELWIGLSPCVADADHDGLLDGLEIRQGADPHAADTDGDGLSDGQEVNQSGTDPCDLDTDNDALSDNDELFYQSDPLQPDTDDDGLEDGDEIAYHTDPNLPDTDADGLMDGPEIALGTNPLTADSDADGLLDGEEVQVYATDPNAADTDGDGLSDGDEVHTYSADPGNWDTDGDALPDGYEAGHAAESPPLDLLNPLDGEASHDGDENPNVHEYWNGSDPWAREPLGGAGCGYWGDAGAGDGVVGPSDAVEMQKVILDLEANYAGVIPNHGETQELDMDGAVGPSDFNILQKMILGLAMPQLGSRPAAITVDEAPVAALAGHTCHVTVTVRNEAGLVASGFGVVFEIDGGQSPGAAVFLGGEGSSAPGSRYDVTGRYFEGSSGFGAPGQASIALRLDQVGLVVFRARIPECGHGAGRSCPEIVSPPIVIEVR